MNGSRTARCLTLGLLLSTTTACAGPNATPGYLVDDLATSPSALPTGAPIESSPAADYLIGQYALGTGDVRAAEGALERALAADPDDLELHRQVFMLNVATGDRQTAVSQARAIVDLDPAADEPRLALFLDDLEAGRYEQARQGLDAMPPRSIGGLIAPLLRAWLELARSSPAEALRLLPQAAANDPFYAVLVYQRAALLALDGRPAEGLPALRGLLDDAAGAPIQATMLATRLIYRAEGQDAARRFIDDRLAAREEPVALERVARQLDRGEAPEPVLTRPGDGVADTLLAIAEALRQQGSTGRAVIYAQLAGWAAPDNGEVALTVAELFISQDNPQAAIDSLARIGPDAPWGWEARLATADALIAGDRDAEAIALLERMAGERPDRIEPLVKLGDLARAQQRYADAVTAYSGAIERLQGLSRRHWRLFYARGVARERTGDWANAVTDLKQALALEPDQVLVLNYLGYSWVDRGENLDEALNMLKRAVELQPRDGFIIDSLGWAYFKLGAFKDATSWLERAVEAKPGDPVINDHLGDAYWRVGRTREARFQWQRALGLSPDAQAERSIARKLAHGLES